MVSMTKNQPNVQKSVENHKTGVHASDIQLLNPLNLHRNTRENRFFWGVLGYLMEPWEVMRKDLSEALEVLSLQSHHAAAQTPDGGSGLAMIMTNIPMVSRQKPSKTHMMTQQKKSASFRCKQMAP